ncbi:FadR/GntR family transcriptional regulator [Amycolatopsis suaedae]|nr:FadR/GntR family transcriptional regulator [Amycolatopsis suaedae]
MEVVLDEIRGAIERGEYAVGDKLPAESALAQEFEVSRSVIREALRATAALGLTVSRTGKGTYVQAAGPVENPIFGDYTARDLWEVRRHVEVPVAGYAATRHRAPDLERLQRLVAGMEAEESDLEWVALDARFHTGIAAACGNPVFTTVIEEIGEALRQQSFVLNQLADRRECSNAEHRAIVEAIAARDSERAEEAMREHLARVEQALAGIVGGS